MKFYTYSNNISTYTKAISLENVRSVEDTVDMVAGRAYYGVQVNYYNGEQENFTWLGKRRI